MQAEVVVVGSELLLGQIVDTNSAVIARHFASIGLDLFYKTTVGDNLARLTAVLQQGFGRSQVIVTSGGIGPTADDVTREAVAAATGRELVFSDHLMGQIEAYFASRGFRLSPSNRRQAYIPAGAIAIENPVGTAPGFIVEHQGSVVVTLPGVPGELEYLLVNRVVPHLRQQLRLEGEIRLRVLKTVGLGESRIGELIGDFMATATNPTVGTVAHLGQVDIRIAAKGKDREAAERLIAPVEREIRARLGDTIFGADEATLETEIRARLRAVRARVGLVEVGAGGLASQRLAGAASDVLAGGAVFGDLAGASRLAPGIVELEDPEAQARDLASAAARWVGAEVGAATCLTGDVAGAGPIRGAVAVDVGGKREAREYRFGGDLASTRIRFATLLLDLIRRSLPSVA